MAAMSVIGALMIQHTDRAPVTHVHGIRKGNVSAGLGPVPKPQNSYAPPTTANKAGAWFVTVLMAFLFLGGGVWTLLPEGEGKFAVSRHQPAVSEKARNPTAPAGNDKAK